MRTIKKIKGEFMATLTIRIKGIALIDIGPTWNIYLPFDKDCHRVVLKSGEIGKVELGDARQQITVSVECPLKPDSVPMPIPIPGKDFSKFLDITHPDLYKNGLHLRKDWFENTVLLTIPGGTYSATRITKEAFSLSAVPGPVPQPLPIYNIGTLGMEGAIVVEGEKIQLDIVGTDKRFPLIFKDDDFITIDNDCDISRNNDFPMLYKYVLSEKTAPQYELKINPLMALPCNSFRVSKPLQVES
jgi:hypothetical protein